MARKVFAVMGATGKVGGACAEDLKRKGHAVKALGRDPSKLTALQSKGMQAVNVSFSDSVGLKEAFRGCDGAFVMIPPAYSEADFPAYQDRVGSSVARALLDARVRQVVFLSSIGADKPAGTGPIAGLYRMEERLKFLSNAQVLHLRPGYFTENLFWSIPVIKAMGVHGTPLRADLKIPMVATKDIGLKAADFLDQGRYQPNEVFEFGGPKDVTMKEATSVMGISLGNPGLEYVQFPYEEAKKGMAASGMKPSTTDLLIEMYQAFNEGRLEPTQKLEGFHRGKTSLEDFLPSFKTAYGKP